ncbi:MULTISPECIES: hypothetical protein [unclassified Paraburkholderia]|uniref:hypothetical protein n=1 Tax=unclassified Paraburkholderia TaxID=2615204 RepID=UPI0016070163|nr:MULTISPECIES: hypothetical protein [unclassified Paraburkholderia]MBB5412072.1 hypothetical protein [Paraburkholderia sp. HC6.4b]MBB5454139.1 hypothetical protein [Paraburkholderia sp. Kb1A]
MNLFFWLLLNLAVPIAAVIDHRQTESVVGALSRGAIGTSIFMTCLAALLSAALHIYLN